MSVTGTGQVVRTVVAVSGPPTFRGVILNRAPVTLLNNVLTDIDISPPDYDTDGSDNGTKWIVPSGMAGYYQILAELTLNDPSDAAHHVYAFYARCAGSVAGTDQGDHYCDGNNVSLHTSFLIKLGVGDDIYFQALQSTGGTRTDTSCGGSFSAQWLGA